MGTGSILEVAEMLVVNITTESTWTNCGHLFLNRQEQSTPDSLTRLQLLTALELVFTRFWARVFCPSSQLLSRPASSPAGRGENQGSWRSLYLDCSVTLYIVPSIAFI